MLNLKKRYFEQINTTMEIFFFFCLINQCQIHRLLSPGFNPPQMALSSTYSRGRGVLWGPDGRRLLSLSLSFSVVSTDCLEDRLFFPPSTLLLRIRVFGEREREDSKGVKRSCEYGATCAVRAPPLFPANCDIGPNDRTSFHDKSAPGHEFFEFSSGRRKFEFKFILFSILLIIKTSLLFPSKFSEI